MSTFIALGAAVLQAASFTLDKAALNVRSISHKMYLAVSFPLLVVGDAVLWVLFRPRLDWAMFSGEVGLMVLASVAILLVTNLLYYRALKHDGLSEINPLALLNNLPIIIVSSIVFVDERNPAIVIPALIAAGAVVWAHWEHHALAIKARTRQFIIWLLLATPVLAVMSKFILEVWHPISLELVRDGAQALIFLPFFASSIRPARAKGWTLLIVTNMLSACAWVLIYGSYQRIGIVATTLLFALQPLLVYFSAVVFLKERFVPKKFFAFLIVLAAIAAAQWMTGITPEG